MEDEKKELDFSEEKINGYLKYAHELTNQLRQVESQLVGYSKYAKYTIKTDMDCLGVETNLKVHCSFVACSSDSVVAFLLDFS